MCPEILDEIIKQGVTPNDLKLLYELALKIDEALVSYNPRDPRGPR